MRGSFHLAPLCALGQAACLCLDGASELWQRSWSQPSGSGKPRPRVGPRASPMGLWLGSPRPALPPLLQQPDWSACSAPPTHVECIPNSLPQAQRPPLQASPPGLAVLFLEFSPCPPPSHSKFLPSHVSLSLAVASGPLSGVPVLWHPALDQSPMSSSAHSRGRAQHVPRSPACVQPPGSSSAWGHGRDYCQRHTEGKTEAQGARLV